MRGGVDFRESFTTILCLWYNEIMTVELNKWNIYEELNTEEDIQAFVKASIAEAENDTDPSLLAHALGVAAKARGMLAVSLLLCTFIDPRSVKKLKDILSLPADDRNDLYRILNKMLRKNQLEKINAPKP